MKKFYSCLIILTFFSSCTITDSMVSVEPVPTANKGGGVSIPAYSINAYDDAGRIYDELFDKYYDGSVRLKSVENIINDVTTIANTNSFFVANNNYGDIQLSAERVEYLSNLGTSDIAGVIGANNLSLTAKTSFSNFLITIAALYATETDATKMYNAVVKYEENVISSNFLTYDDKKIILTTTSIVRYSSYRAKKKPKKNTDPDWLILVTHVLGSEEGAEENMEKAILQGLVTGIVSNS